MATGISYLQAVSAMSASETAQTRQELGTEGVNRANTKRKDLQKEIKERQEEIAKLQEELKQASDYDTWDKICAFFGDDNGVGDLSEDLGKQSAELKRATNELKIAQAQIESMLAELQAAQQDLGNRVSERQKAYDENDRAGEVATS